HQALDDAEADAGALRPPAGRGFNLHESIEDAVDVLGSDTDALVGHAQPDAFPVAAHPDPDLPAGAGELAGVGDEVEHDAVQVALVAVPDEGPARLDVHVDLQLQRLGVGLGLLGHPHHAGAHVHGHAVDARLARLQL